MLLHLLLYLFQLTPPSCSCPFGPSSNRSCLLAPKSSRSCLLTQVPAARAPLARVPDARAPLAQVPAARAPLAQVPAAHAFWPKSQLFLPFSLSIHRPSGFSAQCSHICGFFLAKRSPIWQNPITNPNPTPNPNSNPCWFVSKPPSFVVFLLNFPERSLAQFFTQRRSISLSFSSLT